MIELLIIAVAGTFSCQSCSLTSDDLSFSYEQDTHIVFRLINDSAVVVSTVFIVLVDGLVKMIQIELCSHKQDRENSIFIDKERFPT